MANPIYKKFSKENIFDFVLREQASGAQFQAEYILTEEGMTTTLWGIYEKNNKGEYELIHGRPVIKYDGELDADDAFYPDEVAQADNIADLTFRFISPRARIVEPAVLQQESNKAFGGAN